MEETEAKSSLRRRKQELQALALVIMLGVPGFLYWAAQAGASGWIRVLLSVMAATMGLLTLLK